MTGPLTFYRLSETDIDEMIQLVNSAYRGEGSKQGWTTEADLLDGIRTDHDSIHAQLTKPGSAILCVRDEGNRMVGCVYLSGQGKQLYLGMLTVAPDIQARGIGKKLLTAAEEYAREINCQSIVMSVIDVRLELIDWYKRHGYESTGQILPFPSDPSFGIPKQPLQFIVLQKKL